MDRPAGHCTTRHLRGASMLRATGAGRPWNMSLVEPVPERRIARGGDPAHAAKEHLTPYAPCRRALHIACYSNGSSSERSRSMISRRLGPHHFDGRNRKCAASFWLSSLSSPWQRRRAHHSWSNATGRRHFDLPAGEQHRCRAARSMVSGMCDRISTRNLMKAGTTFMG